MLKRPDQAMEMLREMYSHEWEGNTPELESDTEINDVIDTGTVSSKGTA